MATQQQIDAQDANAILAQPGFRAVFIAQANIPAAGLVTTQLPPVNIVADAAGIQSQIAQGNLLARDFSGNLIIFTTATSSFFSVSVHAIPGSYLGPPAPPTPAPTPTPTPQPGPNQPPIPGEGGGPNTGGTPSPGGTGTTLTPLPTVTLPDVAPSQSFSTTVANALGVLGTPADGWDTLFAGPAGAIDGDTAGLSDLDTFLATADFVEGAFDASTLAPLQPLIDALTAAGDAIF